MKKKKILYILLASCLLFSGCGKKQAASEPTKEVNKDDLNDENQDKNNNDSDMTDSSDAFENTGDSDEISTGYDSDPRLIQSILTKTTKNFFNDRKKSGPVYQYDFCQISLADDEIERYPQLSETLNKISNEIKESTIEAADLNLQDSVDWCAEFAASDYYGYFSDSRKFTILRSDTRVFSARCDYYDFLGGAHGNYGVYSHNIDPISGKELSIDDIFLSREELTNLLYSKLGSEYGEDTFYDYSTLKDSITEEINNNMLVFDIDYHSVNVFFNPYDIAPYACGIFKISLPIKEYAGSIINEKYASVPESYIISIPDESDLFIDLDGGGREDLVKVIPQTPEDPDYGYIDSVTVEVNGESASFDTYAYLLDSYLVKSKEKYFVYTFCLSENDYVHVIVIDINGTTPKLVEAPEENYPGISPSRIYISSDYNDDFYESITQFYMLTDPDNMYMDLRSDVMSTIDVTTLFEINESGFPYYKNKEAGFRVLSQDLVFTAKQDIEGTLIDKDGNETGAYTMKAGTKGTYYRTDNDTYGDLLLEDGTIVRFKVNNHEWPITVNGVNIEEAFDGIIFAG